MFQPFGQASTSSTREYGGAGLGLAITKNIMASLGGHVSCASAVGRGTTMTLDVPLEVPRGSLGSGNSGSETRAAEAFLLRNAEEVVTAVDKRSLGDAIGRVARAGGAAHSHLDVASRFPHTETQRRVWGKEVASGAAARAPPQRVRRRLGGGVFGTPLRGVAPRRDAPRRTRGNVPRSCWWWGRRSVHDPAGEDSVFLSRDGEAPRGASRRSANTKTRDARARARSRLISASIPAPVPALGGDSGRGRAVRIGAYARIIMMRKIPSWMFWTSTRRGARCFAARSR